jgi:NTP pyrophosphatase (non-canonical NTP hydrolase)
MNQDLNGKMAEIRGLMAAKGFSSDESRVWEMLTLIHTEVSEAADAYRKGKDISFVGEELMDAIIRILHLLSILDQDPEQLYREIMRHNRERPERWNTVRGG